MKDTYHMYNSMYEQYLLTKIYQIMILLMIRAYKYQFIVE